MNTRRGLPRPPTARIPPRTIHPRVLSVRPPVPHRMCRLRTIRSRTLRCRIPRLRNGRHGLPPAPNYEIRIQHPTMPFPFVPPQTLRLPTSSTMSIQWVMHHQSPRHELKQFQLQSPHSRSRSQLPPMHWEALKLAQVRYWLGSGFQVP